MRSRVWVRAVRAGRFKKLFGSRIDEWYRFVHRAAATPGRDRIVLRWSLSTDNDEGYIWIVYRIKAASMDRVDLQLEAIYLPNEDEPGSDTATPEELIGEPFFAFP